MIRNTIYWIVSVGSIAAIFLAAPSGALLTTTPSRGPVTANPQGKPTIRGSGTTVLWFGGGYHGGK